MSEMIIDLDVASVPNINLEETNGTIFFDAFSDDFYVLDGDDWHPIIPDTQEQGEVLVCSYCGRRWCRGMHGWDGMTCWDGVKGCGANLVGEA